ncbi:MAG: M20/M25/M40 family metallo-hydrolase [Clostridia bacterium]|nr:M20/M25/M40 family metallo-hydrolase [Clostridia bacterium]MBQ3898077.1 M20/M25/M40 family metallo-hydrolase [Clostridia bacterium]
MSEKFDALIAQKDQSAQYMIKEITHICKDLPKRDPGSEGERAACEYMADVLKKDCGCETVEIESFDENPGSFYGWIHITFTLIFIAVGFFRFGTGPVAYIVSTILIALGFLLAFLQFGIYKKIVDFMFPKKTGTNVTAIKSCKGEVKRRIFFNGHPDAAWEWPANYIGGGVLFESLIIISAIGALYYLVLSILVLVNGGASELIWKLSTWGILFAPFWIYMFFMWNPYRVVDGANDNLTGCYMGISILKAMKDAGIELENTEVGVILTGSEEAGLRGAKAWCEAHKGEYRDVPTFIYSYDTIYDPKYLLVNYRDLNATVKADKDVSDLFMEAAQELDILCNKGMVPPLGGATDNAAFAQGGFRSTGITGLNHKLESYYHTRKDTYTNMNAGGLADCYAVSVRVLDKFDQGAKQEA